MRTRTAAWTACARQCAPPTQCRGSSAQSLRGRGGTEMGGVHSAERPAGQLTINIIADKLRVLHYDRSKPMQQRQQQPRCCAAAHPATHRGCAPRCRSRRRRCQRGGALSGSSRASWRRPEQGGRRDGQGGSQGNGDGACAGCWRSQWHQRAAGQQSAGGRPSSSRDHHHDYQHLLPLTRRSAVLATWCICRPKSRRSAKRWM